MVSDTTCKCSTTLSTNSHFIILSPGLQFVTTCSQPTIPTTRPFSRIGSTIVSFPLHTKCSWSLGCDGPQAWNSRSCVRVCMIITIMGPTWCEFDVFALPARRLVAVSSRGFGLNPSGNSSSRNLVVVRPCKKVGWSSTEWVTKKTSRRGETKLDQGQNAKITNQWATGECYEWRLRSHKCPKPRPFEWWPSLLCHHVSLSVWKPKKWSPKLLSWSLVKKTNLGNHRIIMHCDLRMTLSKQIPSPTGSLYRLILTLMLTQKKTLIIVAHLKRPIEGRSLREGSSAYTLALSAWPLILTSVWLPKIVEKREQNCKVTINLSLTILSDGQRMTGSDGDHVSHNVLICNHLTYWVLDLKAQWPTSFQIVSSLTKTKKERITRNEKPANECSSQKK